MSTRVDDPGSGCRAPRWLVPLLLLAGAVGSCAGTSPGAGADEPVDASVEVRLFHGGTIYVDPSLPPVEALLARDGFVVACGDEEDVRAQLDGPVEEVDLAGGIGVPGLQDAHGHLLGLGGTLEEVNLVGAASFEEVVRRVAARAAELEPGAWITGRGWDQSLWEDRSFPTHAALSRAVGDHPVLVRRVDGHAALANLEAMRRSGLLDAYPVPAVEGGRVAVDGEGRPTGPLVDTAMGLVSRHVPPVDRATIRRRLLLAQEALLAQGLVCVHDMGIDAQTAEVLVELEREGALRLRVLAYLWANDGLDAATAARFPRPSDLDPGSRLRVVGAKLMLDGALGSRGAALLEPYADAPDETGLLRMDGERFGARVAEVAAAGLQPATHAIGDRANRLALDVYAALLARDPLLRALRPRIEHAQVVSAADWARFDELGVVASMQPTHATTDMRWAEDRIGAERLRGAYAWRRLTARADWLAFGSDFPVEPSDPLLGLYAARTRQDADGRPPGGWLSDQRLCGVEALAAFTSGAARAAREEDERGLLLEGYRADMTVLSVDPIYDAPLALRTAHVLATVVDGEVVFERARTP
jgi:hypothetical protein